MSKRFLFDWQREVRASDLDATTKHVALTVSTYMNPDGTGAWPSTATLAADTGRKPTTVRAKLRKLEDAGWLGIERRHGRGNTHRYTALIPLPVKGSSRAPFYDVANDTEKGPLEALKGSPRGTKRVPRGTPTTQDHSEDHINLLCAEAHPRLKDTTKAQNLAQRVGISYALDALEEVNLQLNHPELREAPIDNAFAYAGAIARCYKLKCDDAPYHGDDHGIRRREYHRGRRRDYAVADRAEEARRRAPSDPDAEYREDDAERQRQKAALAEVERLSRRAAL